VQENLGKAEQLDVRSSSILVGDGVRKRPQASAVVKQGSIQISIVAAGGMEERRKFKERPQADILIRMFNSLAREDARPMRVRPGRVGRFHSDKGCIGLAPVSLKLNGASSWVDGRPLTPRTLLFRGYTSRPPG